MPYWHAIRGPFLFASCIPALLGTAISYAELGRINLPLFLASLFGCLALHAGANAANEYYDWLLGADAYQSPQAFSGGSQMVEKGLLPDVRLRQVYLTLYVVAGILGVLVARRVGYLALVIGGLGLLFGHFYTAPPVSFSYRGWGELVTGITFGPLIVLGTYYAQTARLDWRPMLASMPLGLLITAVLYINEFPDRESDAVAGKRNWVVLTQGQNIGIYQALVLFAILAAMPLLSTTSPWVICLYLPIAVLGLQAAWQGKRIFLRPERLLPVQAKTMLFYALTGLFLCIVYLKA